MNALAKTALIAGGLAFLFKDQVSSALFGAAPSPATPAPAAPSPAAPLPATPSPVTPVAPVVPPPSPAVPPPAANVAVNFSQWISNTLGTGRKMFPADTWNFYYSKWSGVEQTADLFPPDNRGADLSLTEYLSRRGEAGLSGLVMLGRVR